MKLAFLTTHLTGSGHFVRTVRLARAGQAAGHRVLVLTGGRALPHVPSADLAVVQLPPLSVQDLDYGTLRDGEGQPATEAYLAARRQRIVTELRAFQPDILVTETFPLGRRALAAEFEAALAEAPRAVASVRDIPEPKPKRVAEAAGRLASQYDALLVHGEADFIPLSATWPLPEFASRTHHTGYIAGEAPPPISGGVVVAVGGGALGRALLEAAAEAARHSSLPWRLLTTETGLPPAPNLTIEPLTPDYPALVAGARASISLCGYNTAVELARTETPAILVPMADRGEREQTLRAEALARYPGIELLREPSPEALLEALSRLPARRAPLPLRLDGARRSIEIL
ncbi:MAG: glycosyl transferase family 28, partial [Pseudomonadota bacterium]